MFFLYLGCLIVGGGLVLASFFSDHDHDADVDMDLDLDVDADVDLDLDADHDVDVASSVDAADAIWLPLLSLRFWIFFTAFFGLTGTLLEGLDQAGFGLTLGLSLGMGLISGYSVSRIVRALRQEKVNSAVDPHSDYVGRRGEVLLDVLPDDPGQVRLQARGTDIDLPAVLEPDAREAVRRGATVVVLEYNAGTLVVAPFSLDEEKAANPPLREMA